MTKMQGAETEQTRHGDAWDPDGVLGDWIGGTEFADDEGAERMLPSTLNLVMMMLI
jgi:hypothetical protein